MKNKKKNPFKANRNEHQELRKIIKKQQKIIKIKQKNVILMSEKIAVTLINKVFSQKDKLKQSIH